MVIDRKLAEETHNEFMGLVAWSENEQRDLPVEGHLQTNKMKGHILNMKKAGLVETYRFDMGGEKAMWLTFTDEGLQYAQKHGGKAWKYGAWA